MQFLISPPDSVGLREIMEVHRFDPCSGDYRDALEYYFENPDPEPIDEAIDTWHELGVDVGWAKRHLGLSGDGYGDGSGYGYGDGYGYGSGSGYGDGYGSGSGYGDGYGYGY
jgi:hypothetical protein